MLLLLLTLPRTRGTGRMVGSELLPPVKGKKYEKKTVVKIYSVVPTRAELTVLLNACQLRRRFQEVVHRVLCIVALNYSFLI